VRQNHTQKKRVAYERRAKQHAWRDNGHALIERRSHFLRHTMNVSRRIRPIPQFAFPIAGKASAPIPAPMMPPRIAAVESVSPPTAMRLSSAPRKSVPKRSHANRTPERVENVAAHAASSASSRQNSSVLWPARRRVSRAFGERDHFGGGGGIVRPLAQFAQETRPSQRPCALSAAASAMANAPHCALASVW
jgi:hypothetical protein